MKSIALLLLLLCGISQAQQIESEPKKSAVQQRIRTGASGAYLDNAPGSLSTMSNAIVDKNGNILLNGWSGTISIGAAGITFNGGLPQHFLKNQSTATQTPVAATRTYIAGSGLTISAGQIQVGTHIHWRFDMTKTAAGTAASTFDIAFGTAGTTADTARVSFTKPAGTAAIDEGWVDIDCIVKTNSASGVVVGEFIMVHNLASTGHATIPCVVVNTTSSTFDTTLPTNIGICITTGASDAITINQIYTAADNL